MRIDEIQQEMVSGIFNGVFYQPKVAQVENKVVLIPNPWTMFIINQEDCLLDLTKFKTYEHVDKYLGTNYDKELTFTNTLNVTSRCYEAIYEDKEGEIYRIDEEFFKYFQDCEGELRFFGKSPSEAIFIVQDSSNMALVLPIVSKETTETQEE